MIKGRPKMVTIQSLELVEFSSGTPAKAVLDVTCSPGTYVRVLADDIGTAVGCGAYLAFLVRTRAGRFGLSEALSIEEVSNARQQDELPGAVLPLDWPLPHVPELSLGAAEARSFATGNRVLAGEGKAWPIRVYGPQRVFLGLGEVVGEGKLQPRVVLAEGAASAG
jgi:tRNA pseudouridine55 synthase